MKARFRPRVLAILPGFMPSTIICVVKPLVRLHQTGLLNAIISLESLVTNRTIESADLIIFCRNTEPQYSQIMQRIQARRIPYIYDIDDNFFEISPESELGRYHRSVERLAMLTHYIKSADLVRVYSKPLLERALNLNPRVEEVSGPVDWNLISAPAKNTGKVKIVFATARVYDDMAEIVMPALSKVLKTHGSEVEVHFWGNRPENLSKLSNIRFHRLIYNYDTFFRKFSQAGFDIGLAPLKDDVFYRSKTNNKFREYGACHIAGIYSDMEVYSSCVTNSETGLLVSNDTEAWFKAIVRLLEQPDLREKIKSKAYEYVRQNYSQTIFANIWWEQIKSALDDKSSPIRYPSLANETFLRQEEDNKKAVSHHGEKEESILNPINRKIRSFFRHLQQHGFRLTFWLVRRSFYNYWMILRLRMITSNTTKILQ